MMYELKVENQQIFRSSLKTFQVESLFLWAFVLALVRRMTASAAAAVTTVLFTGKASP